MTVARCELCWQVFPSEMDLLRHEATEDDRLYDLDGVGDHGPGGDHPVGPTESKPHRPPSESPQSDGSA